MFEAKEEGLQKLNLASKTLKFSGANLLSPAVVVVWLLKLLTHFSLKKSFFLPAQIGVSQCPGNILAPQAHWGLVCFKDARPCITSTWVSQSAAYPNRSLPDCCFLEAALSHSSCRQILTG